MKRITQKRIVIFSFIVSTFILADFYLPGEVSKVGEFETFECIKVSRYRGYEIHDYINLNNGDSYRIGKIPKVGIENGEKIEIMCSRIFNKTNEIRYFDNGWKKLTVSFLPKGAFLCLAISSMIIFVFHFFVENSALYYSSIINFLLVFFATLIHFCS